MKERARGGSGLGRGAALAGLTALAWACASIAGLEDVPVPADGGGDGSVTTGGGHKDAMADAFVADATMDGGVDAPGEGEAGEAGEGGEDATVADAGADAVADAAADVLADAMDASPTQCTPQGTRALGKLGCPSTSPGDLPCNGNAQKLSLVCSGGSWT